MRYENLFLLAFLAFMVSCQQFSDEPKEPFVALGNENPIVNSSSSVALDTEIPIMDSRVVAYLRIEDRYGNTRFIDNTDTLKSWFPPYENVLYKEECNYFAAIFPLEKTMSYVILSQDMTLHLIQPDPAGKKGECEFYYPRPTIAQYHAMLICDDEAGTIRNSMNFDSIASYTDSSWDCEREGPTNRNAYFTYAYIPNYNGEPIVATEMPVMDSRVVSYQTANWSGGLGFRGIIAEPDVLDSWFPNNLNNEECNYFAIFNSTNSTSSGHLVLAEDMVLYHLGSSAGEWCMETADIFYDVMLVCDNVAGTFRNNINLNGSYAVPGWDCNKWETVPEKGYF